MKKFAKLTALLLAMTMVLGLAACGKTGAESKSGEDEKIKITIGVAARPSVASYEDNAFTRYLQEKTGYEIEFMPFSSSADEYTTQLATMIAGGEKLPDMLYGFAFSSAMQSEYGAEGYFVDLTPYFEDEELTADYRARVAELYGPDHYDYVLRAIKSADGKIYGYPTVADSEADMPWNMVYINTVWLDKLGLEMPTNYEEFVEVLRAFKTQDPNGNGKADEIPAIGATYLGNANMPGWILNNWEYVYDSYYFKVEDGKVGLPYVTDDYRKGVQALHDLVAEGLLPTMTWTIGEASEYTALITPADETAICGVFAGHLLSILATDNPVAYEYQPLMPFNYAPIRGSAPSTNLFITTDAENPDACFKLMQAISTEEGSMACRYGEEGVDWEWSSDYATGKPAVGVLNANAFGTQTKSTWGQTCGILTKYGPSGKYHTAVASAPEDMTWNEHRNQRNNNHAMGYVALAEERNPAEVINWTLVYNQEEQDRLGNLQTEIYTYVRETRAKFAAGELDPYDDAEWNRYLQTLESMGMSTWLECAQSAYDRFMAG